MDLLMGIDLGSTSLKAIVYDLDGNVVSQGSRPTEVSRPDPDHPDWAVWEPDHIAGGTLDAIRDAVAGLDDPRQIRGMAVTGMGMDGLPVDEAGQWLYPMISWHDGRTGPQYDWWIENVTAEKTFSIGGNPVWPINSALRIRWVAENEPDALARAAKWLLIEDFVNLTLCGRMATDYSMASCMMLFDQRTRDWSDEMLGLAGIDRRLMPEALPSATPLGNITPEVVQRTGLAEGTPVILGGHDHICGSLPVGAFRPGLVLDITGTWEAVQAPVSEAVLDDRLRQMGITVQAHVARDRYAVWGGNPAGGMLEWFRGEFGHEARQKAEAEGTQDWDHLIAAAAATPPGARGVMFLPHMSGSSCPIVDGNSRGAFVGLTNRATAGDLLRAVIEGLDYQFLEVVEAMETALATKIDRFVAVGGAVRNEFWMQNKADVTGRPVEVPAIEEATPLGAAILAGIGVGLYADEEDALGRVYRPGGTFEPDEKLHEQYAEWFGVYRELYPALKGVHGQMK